MNGESAPQTFTDFLSPTTSSEGPVETPNIERQRYKRKRQAVDKMKKAARRQRKRRSRRAS
jgi:hypothetical protein